MVLVRLSIQIIMCCQVELPQRMVMLVDHNSKKITSILPDSRVKAPLSGFLQPDGNYLPSNLAPFMVCIHRGSILHLPLPKLVIAHMEGCTIQHRLLLEVLFIHCSSHRRLSLELLKWLAHLPMVISSSNMLR